jgi:hypothetical protein
VSNPSSLTGIHWLSSNSHRLFAWVVGLVAIGVIVATICAYRHDNGNGLAALGVGTTVVGFALAYVAVRPVLEEATKRPAIRLFAQVWDGGDDTPRDVKVAPIENLPKSDRAFSWHEGSVEVVGREIYMRAVINTQCSQRTVVGILNIIVLHACEIEVVPGRAMPVTAYASAFTDRKDEINGHRGRDFNAVPTRYVAQERSWPPGANSYVVGVKIATPSAGDWPVLIALDGDGVPTHRRRTRVWIKSVDPSPPAAATTRSSSGARLRLDLPSVMPMAGGRRWPT